MDKTRFWEDENDYCADCGASHYVPSKFAGICKDCAAIWRTVDEERGNE